MTTVNMLEAKITLSRLVESIEAGKEQEIIIARNGRPAARLTGVPGGTGGQRFGIARGLFRAPDTIDHLNPVIASLFNGD